MQLFRIMDFDEDDGPVYWSMGNYWSTDVTRAKIYSNKGSCKSALTYHNDDVANAVVEIIEYHVAGQVPREDFRSF